MALMERCPLTGIPCAKPITIENETFFLAEPKEPEVDRERRREALATVLEREYKYKIRSALDESGTNAFTCKICKMIQTCAYGMADISQNNANVLLELGMMIALGKPTIILSKRGEEQELKLPSDLSAIEIIPFMEYIDVIDQLRRVAEKLPPPVSPPNPIEDITKLLPKLAEELKNMEARIVEEFKESAKEAKLDVSLPREEKEEIASELAEKLKSLEEKLEDMRRLGFVADAETAFLRGNYFYNRGEYEDALAAYNWSLELRPDDPVTLMNRGVTYRHLGRYDEALADYNRSLELRPDDPNTLNNRGVTYRHLGRYDESLADYNRSLELRPDDPDTLPNRGNTYDELGRHEEALADFNRSLQLSPDDPVTLMNRGITYVKLERYDEALADYNRSLEIRPDDPVTLYNLACLFSLRGKTGDAVASLEKAIEKDKKYREKARTDKDFDNIRDDPRFKKLIEPD